MRLLRTWRAITLELVIRRCGLRCHLWDLGEVRARASYLGPDRQTAREAHALHEGLANLLAIYPYLSLSSQPRPPCTRMGQGINPDTVGPPCQSPNLLVGVPMPTETSCTFIRVGTNPLITRYSPTPYPCFDPRRRKPTANNEPLPTPSTPATVIEVCGTPTSSHPSIYPSTHYPHPNFPHPNPTCPPPTEFDQPQQHHPRNPSPPAH